MSIKLSIIMPVYNVEEYIEEAFYSVVAQLTNDVELIVVNDGTPDKSIDLIRETILSDKRIKLIEQKNRGLSAARNYGLKYAEGRYIYFIDSDDCLVTGSIKYVLEYIQFSCDRDLIVVEYEMFDELSKTKLISKQINATIDDQMTALKNLKSPLCNVWRYIVRRNLLINNMITFREGALCEDIEWLAAIYQSNPSVAYISSAVYVYRMNRAGSIMEMPTEKRIRDVFFSISMVLERLKKKGQFNSRFGRCVRKLLFIELLYNCSFVCRLRKEKKLIMINNVKLYSIENGIRYFILGLSIEVFGLINVSRFLNRIRKIKQ